MVFSAQLSENMSSILDRIKDNFEENLKRHFSQEGSRYFYAEEKNTPLGSYMENSETSEIALIDLKVAQRPQYDIVKLNADLHRLNLELELNLGTVQIDGNYIETNIQTSETVSQKIRFKLENISAAGIVGLFTRGDSFRSENYDLKFTPTGVITEIISVASKSTAVKEPEEKKIKEFKSEDVNETLIKIFWDDLVNVLTDYFQVQLVAVIVEYSVMETLIDEDKPMKAFSKDQVERTSKLIDSLLINVKNYLIENNLQEVETLNLKAISKNNLKFQAKYSLFRGLSTVTPKGNFSVLEGEDLLIYGNFELDEFKHEIKDYTLQIGEVNLKGSCINVDHMYRNKIFTKIRLSKGSFKVEEVRVFVNYSSIKMEGPGEDYLDDLEPALIALVKNFVVPIIKERLECALNASLKKIDLKVLMG